MELQGRDYWLRQLGCVLSDAERANYGILTDRAKTRIIEGYTQLLEALLLERAMLDALRGSLGGVAHGAWRRPRRAESEEDAAHANQG